MAKINKLNSGVILSAYSKEFTQKKLTLDINGKNYEVLVDEKFKNTKIQAMVLESVTNFKKLEGYEESVKLAYYMFLMVKHFTDIELANTEDFEEQVRVLNAMVDLDIFGKVTSAFPEEEINKVNEFLKKFGDKMKELNELNNKELEDMIKDELKDEEVIE